MNKDVLLEKIIYLNENSKKLFDKSLKDIAKKYNLTKSEVFILSIINHNPNTLKSCNIVKKHNFSKAHVSQVINSLKEKKYIDLNTDSVDKRYQKIELLTKSKDIFKDLEESFAKNLKIIKKGLTKDDVSAFINIIDRIINNLKENEEEK